MFVVSTNFFQLTHQRAAARVKDAYVGVSFEPVSEGTGALFRVHIDNSGILKVANFPFNGCNLNDQCSHLRRLRSFWSPDRALRIL